ncbi:MAG: hypothetical protein ACERKV_09910 [Clostridiaceae bacterium]
MALIYENCKSCPEYRNNRCEGNDTSCMCFKCPRNLGECIITRYCRETESVLDLDNFAGDNDYEEKYKINRI